MTLQQWAAEHGVYVLLAVLSAITVSALTLRVIRALAARYQGTDSR